MSLANVEYKEDRVYDFSNPLSLKQKEVPEWQWGLSPLEISFFLDGDPLITGSHDHCVRSTSVLDLNSKAFVSLQQPDPYTNNIIYPPYWQRGQSSSSPVDEYELRALAIAQDIYKLSGEDDDVALLRACFGAIESAFAKAEVQIIDALLETLDTSKVPSIASLGIARATARARNFLPNWASYVAKLKDHLIAQGEEVSQSMRGLITKNDQFTFVTRRLAL